ncbi:MAG: LysR family transcriptional regulator [Bacteroidales bacterium]|nr:LysR family transcriptional regulator [Bacteroidales bacterium]
MLEDFRLEVFIAVVNERSFTKAAAALGISQPAVSQNIAELEKTVGRKLFERLRGEVVPTADAEVLMIYVKKLMETCASVGDMFSKVSPSVVKIAASEEIYAYLVGPALDAFSKVHPNVRFERSIFGDADLTIALVPSKSSTDEVISRIRMSVFVPQQADAQSSSREKTSYFDVVFRPSQAFAVTRLCRLIRQFLVK